MGSGFTKLTHRISLSGSPGRPQIHRHLRKTPPAALSTKTTVPVVSQRPSKTTSTSTQKTQSDASVPNIDVSQPDEKDGEKGLTHENVENYLASHPEFLQRHVLQDISPEALIGMVNQRRRDSVLIRGGYRIPEIQEEYCDLQLINQCENILKECTTDAIDVKTLLNGIAHILAGALRADGFSTYDVDTDQNKLYNIDDYGTRTLHGPIQYNFTVASHAVKDKKTMLINDIRKDMRFRQGVGTHSNHAHSVLCLPLVIPPDNIIGALEFTRDNRKKPFSELDLQTVNGLASWIVVSLHQFELNKILQIQHKLNDFLLGTTRIMFDDMTSIDSLIKKIMMFTKDLVAADRSALFLVDVDTNELYADYFDEGMVDEEGKPIFERKTQIRFPKDKGIAGYVATTGQVVNIHDAYNDSRFNREIDKRTGYTTKHILCMPIISKDSIVGVIQLINRKTGDYFTTSDENAFTTFAVYCALALHYSKLYGLLQQQQDKYTVAMEMLHYHQQCSYDEHKEMMTKLVVEVPPDLSSYDFYCYNYELTLPQLFIEMLKDLFGRDCCDMERMCRFTLTVRKNYRPILYHNWKHAFHVAHCVYLTLKNSQLCDDKEAKAAVIAAICHDLDHRGYNNAYFTKTHASLAALYSTSVMEQHHYKQTVTILQQEGTDIFRSLSRDDYRKMLEAIRFAIMATDLAQYFPNQKKLSQIVKDGKADLTNYEFKMETLSLLMTAADLCAICKPWAYQQETVQYVYDEFYMQGDEEKKRGIEPLAMMDRAKKDDMPKQQVGFIQFVCIPCYQTLYDILPCTKDLLEGCKRNLASWKQVADQVAEKAKAAD